MTTASEPQLGALIGEAAQLCVERDRPDLLAKLIDELWLIARFPTEQFPDGPPAAVVERLQEQRERNPYTRGRPSPPEEEQ